MREVGRLHAAPDRCCLYESVLSGAMPSSRRPSASFSRIGRFGLITLLAVLTGATSACAQTERRSIARGSLVTVLDSASGNGRCAKLGALAAIPAHVRVVGLGEATHGTAEFGRFKANAIECWLRTAGISTVAIEAAPSGWEPIDAFVRGGSGHLDSLLVAQGFWMWNTPEMRTMLLALRAWNVGEGRARPVRVVGVDPKYPDRSMHTVLAGIREQWPAVAARFEPTLRGFPATRDAYVAWLKLSPAERDSLTADVLLLPAVIDSLAAGANGEADWNRIRWHARAAAHAVTMEREDAFNWATGDVGAEITLYLRLAHSLDVALQFAQRIDSARASRLASTLAPLAGSYLTIWREYTQQWSSKRRQVIHAAADSLVQMVSNTTSQHDSTTRQGARSAALDVVAALGMFDAYVGRARPPRAARDTAMADLVALALLQDGPEGRVVVWAHDCHTSRTPISFFEGQTMGEALARQFRRGYLSVGFAFGVGDFTAEWYPAPGTLRPTGVVRPGQLTTFHVTAARPGEGEYALAALAPSDFTLDLRGETPSWTKDEQTYRRFGSGYNDLWYEQIRLKSSLAKTFDVLVFVQRATAATQLKSHPLP